MIKIIEGNLLDSKEQYIAHQCNCISNGAGGVAKAIFDKYPYSNVYEHRIIPDTMGTIQVSGNGMDKRFIINMFSQYYPGYHDDGCPHDNVPAREKAFYHCLLKIAQIKDLQSIAFPYLIGCGLGGGDWNTYLGKLENFAKYVKETKNTEVVLFHLK